MSFTEQLKNNIKNNKKGFSLLELVLAVAIFSFSSFALASMIIDSNISTRLSADRTEALLYAKEGIEAVRSIRDNDWATWMGTPDGDDYGLVINEASSTWIFDNSPDLINNDKYTRTITLTTNSEVDSSRDVSVNISWDLTPGRTASTTLKTVFSNWPDVINSPFVIPRGLVSYYSFDDAGDGTALDSIGENDGTVTGATATTSVRGTPNQAYSFNGNSDYIDGGDFLNTGLVDVTIAGWIYLSNYDTRQFFFDKESNTPGIYPMELAITSANTLAYYCGTSPNHELVGNSVLNQNTWYHFAYVGTANSKKIYLNGVLDASDENPGSFMVDTTNNLFLGKRGDNTEMFKGYLDNIRIYRRALTPDDITTIYNAENP